MPQVVSAQESAYNGIKQRIMDGRLRPGDRLLHRNLAKELNVSSISVVPALRMLELDGLVINTPGMGARVRIQTKDEIIDLYHIRSSLESLASRLAAERATYSDIESIAKFNETFKEMTIKGDYAARYNADLGFHLAVVEAAHSRELQRLLENLCVINATMVLFSIQSGIKIQPVEGTATLHDPILAAIKDRNPEAAWKATVTHVENSMIAHKAWIETTCDALQNVDENPQRLSVGSMLSAAHLAVTSHR